MSRLLRLATHLRAAAVLRGPNLRGWPLIPKRFWPEAPHNRTLFNQFVIWIDRLRLERVRSVVDVGANHGDFAQAASALFPETDVLLVEPLPILHAELERRAARRASHWKLAKYALSRERGTAALHIDEKLDDIASLVGFSDQYLRSNPNARSEKTLSCEVCTLDDLCAERGIREIDLLKIDVEGFEFEVLEGARAMLSATRALVVEVSLIRRSGDADAIERILKLFRTFGFQLVDLLPSIFSNEAPWCPVEFNVLARRG